MGSNLNSTIDKLLLVKLKLSFHKYKYSIFQNRSLRPCHLAAMAKAAENLSALESSLLKLTEPGGCTVETLITFVYGVRYYLFVKKKLLFVKKKKDVLLFLISSMMNQPKQ